MSDSVIVSCGNWEGGRGGGRGAVWTQDALSVVYGGYFVRRSSGATLHDKFKKKKKCVEGEKTLRRSKGEGPKPGWGWGHKTGRCTTALRDITKRLIFFYLTLKCPKSEASKRSTKFYCSASDRLSLHHV